MHSTLTRFAGAKMRDTGIVHGAHSIRLKLDFVIDAVSLSAYRIARKLITFRLRAVAVPRSGPLSINLILFCKLNTLPRHERVALAKKEQKLTVL
jgi:hypothetical protein